VLGEYVVRVRALADDARAVIGDLLALPPAALLGVLAVPQELDQRARVQDERFEHRGVDGVRQLGLAAAAHVLQAHS
jgi:hypothetical protein